MTAIISFNQINQAIKKDTIIISIFIDLKLTNNY